MKLFLLCQYEEEYGLPYDVKIISAENTEKAVEIYRQKIKEDDPWKDWDYSVDVNEISLENNKSIILEI